MRALLITAIGSVIGSSALWAQAPQAERPQGQNKASAYYHYALAHMYAEQASMLGNRGDFVNKAIENYKDAIKATDGRDVERGAFRSRSIRTPSRADRRREC
jgi:hypothetical protein